MDSKRFSLLAEGHRGGVQGYIAFLRGKRVTYWGRTGDQHTEWFPGVRAETVERRLNSPGLR